MHQGESYPKPVEISNTGFGKIGKKKKNSTKRLKTILLKTSGSANLTLHTIKGY